MSRKDMFEGLADRSKRAVSAEPAPVARRFSAAMSQMRDRLEKADEIEQALAAGERVVEIDPALIDPSPIRDRLRGSIHADDDFRRAIAEQGQQVPVLLRRHPSAAGRFLTIYGHRRIAALTVLGRHVRAVIAEMSDDEAYVAQGVENNARRDLSYIERALFAQRLADAGTPQARIAAALHTAQPNVSAMIGVARRLPAELVEAIGASPGVGGPKWERLADGVKARAKTWRTVIGAEGFADLEGDERFERVAAALEVAKPGGKPVRDALTDRQGASYGALRRTNRGARFDFGNDADVSFRADRAQFADWLVARLDDLRDAWRRGD